jgi:hypothetical protein
VVQVAHLTELLLRQILAAEAVEQVLLVVLAELVDLELSTSGGRLSYGTFCESNKQHC